MSHGAVTQVHAEYADVRRCLPIIPRIPTINRCVFDFVPKTDLRHGARIESAEGRVTHMKAYFRWIESVLASHRPYM
jgi:hypothetical protein